ncbi:MAG: sulfotransferase [Planctomycetota bacterium]
MDTTLANSVAAAKPQPSPNLATGMRKPNLVVVGAMKASTTTFYELITRHPDIWFSAEKEPHYFTSPNYGDEAAWTSYLRLFESAPADARFVGEASTGYSKQPHFGDTPRRLLEDLSNPHLVYLLRDPVERTISNYQHAYLTGCYPAGTTLGEAVERDPILIDASCYERQIVAFLEMFSTDQLLIVLTDKLHADPTATMRRVEAFLDLPAFDGWDTPLQQSNSKHALSGSLAAQSLLPKSVISLLRSVVPTGLRGKLKQIVSKPIEVPLIEEADRELVFQKIADDLVRLRNRLGDSIALWPSVRKLAEG